MCSPPKVRFFFITKYLTLFTSIYLSTISIFNPQIWLLTSLSHSALLTSKISDISCPSILKKKKKTSLFWQISGKAQDTSYIQRSPQLAGMFWDSNVFVGDGKSQVLSLQIHALDSNIRWKITGQIILYLTLYK